MQSFGQNVIVDLDLVMLVQSDGGGSAGERWDGNRSECLRGCGLS